MQELYRVLKPGGMAVIQIPQDLTRAHSFEDNSITDKKKRAEIFGQYDHVRIYGRDFFEKLQKIGFTVTQEDFINQLPADLIHRYCLMPGELIPVCTKQ
jgi:hypothetical protein